MTTKIKVGLINADAVETASIKDAQVTAAKLATDSVTTVKIEDGAVTAAKLATAATGLPTAYIGGLRLSNDTDTAHDVNITAGQARDATDAKDITLASEITKRIDAAWAVGNDAGGLDGTESSIGTPDSSTLYYVWLILRSDTSVVDALFSESATSPTMPTNYDYKRLIGCVKTDGSANIIAFTHRGDYFRYTGDVILDINDTSTTASFETAVISCPANCLAEVYVGAESGSGVNLGATVRPVSSADDGTVDEASVYAVISHDGGSDVDYTTLTGVDTVLVNSSSQIQYAGQALTSTVTVATKAFTMLTRTDP